MLVMELAGRPREREWRTKQSVVKTGKVKIQDAVDFYDWARKNENSSLVSYRFYSKE